jgi:hypothetical protein
LQLVNTSSADNKIKLRTIACFFIDSPPGRFPAGSNAGVVPSIASRNRQTQS